MASAETSLVRDLLVYAAETSSSGAEIAGGLRKAAADIQTEQDAMRTQVLDVVQGVDGISEEDLGGVIDAGVQENLPDNLTKHIDVAPQGGESLDYGVVITTLETTANDINTVVGGKTAEVLDGGIAGQAYQGVPGSSQIDVTSTIKGGDAGTSVVDAVQLKDIVDHEEEHERQAQGWNAESIVVAPGVVLNRHNVSETGAMSVQQTLANVSGGYRQIYADVTGVVSADSAREAARTGDLIGLAEQVASQENLIELNGGQEQQILQFTSEDELEEEQGEEEQEQPEIARKKAA